MDFVNKAYAQVVELFRSMSPAARITTALLLAVLVAAVVFLFRYQLAGDGEYLLSGQTFSSSELADMEAAFAKAGLSGSKIEGNRILIPRGMKAEYLAALADNSSLPRNLDNVFDDIFKSENPFTGSSELRRQKIENAKAKHISMVISKMEGVEWATVQFDEDRPRGLRPTADSRAGVAVKPRGGAFLDAERVQAIRRTVAAYKSGLKLENVTVTDLNAGRAHVGTSGTIDGVDSTYAAHKAQYENTWREKVLAQLSGYPGVVVGVDVELDPTLQLESRKFDVDPKMSAPVAQRDSSKSSTNTQPLPNGRPGTVPNGVGNTQAAIGTESGAKSETSENLTENQLVVTHGTMSSKQAPLTPKKVKVSIGVPSSYYDKVWREQNPPADGAEQGAPDPAEIARIEQEVKKEIEEAVVNLVPAPAPGVDAYTPVRVTSFTDIPLAAEPEPDMVDEATSWLAANWPTLGMSFLGLVSLLMLRSMLRSGAAAPTPTPDASAARAATRPEEEEQPGETVEQAQQRKLRARRAAGGPSLRDELVEMVKEDPDAAANILRSWIGDAA